jgi:hypothetical protein
MFLANHPLNEGVINYLRKEKNPKILIAAPDSVADPYWKQDSHPDVVMRVWDQLGKALPQDCRCLVCGTPSLVHPFTGIILAFCMGTEYCLRLRKPAQVLALKYGAKTSIKWSTGRITDLSKTLGSDWIFGKWLKDEIEWCLNVYDSLNDIQNYLSDENLS